MDNVFNVFKLVNLKSNILHNIEICTIRYWHNKTMYNILERKKNETIIDHAFALNKRQFVLWYNDSKW